MCLSFRDDFGVQASTSAQAHQLGTYLDFVLATLVVYDACKSLVHIRPSTSSLDLKKKVCIFDKEVRQALVVTANREAYQGKLG